MRFILLKIIPSAILLYCLYRAVNSVERDMLRTTLESSFLLSASNPAYSIIHLLTFLCTFVATFMLTFIRPWQLRSFFFLLFFLCYSLDAVFLKIQGTGLQIFNIELLFLYTADYLQSAEGFRILMHFSQQIAEGVGRGLFVTAGLIIASIVLPFRFGYRAAIPVVVSCLLIPVSLYQSSGSLHVTPSYFKIPALSFSYLLDSMYRGPRLPVETRPHDVGFPTIILIVDESVRGDFLSVNGYPNSTTPFLESKRGDFINYGIVSSVTNCSWSSDLLLRSGLQPESIPDRGYQAMRVPSIFQFARKAGYTTYFFDAQMEAGGTYMLVDEELKFIDRYVSLRGTEAPTPERDTVLMKKALKLISQTPKSFAIFHKQGAHVPYADRAPAGTATAITDQLSSMGRKGFPQYEAAVYYSVDRFFKEHFNALQQPGFAVLYTSDHGQSLGETATNTTHCDWLTPASSQASVPFMVFGAAGIQYVHDRPIPPLGTISQFQTFSTLLEWMGYTSAEHPAYGVTVRHPAPEKRVFVAGSIFGKSGFRIVPFVPPRTATR